VNNYKISLAAARVNAGMTQNDIAKKMHISKNTVINWEKGKVELKPAQFKMYCEIVKAPEDAISLPTIQL
jgi:DNA-binding XRE family transcriptional regulator